MSTKQTTSLLADFASTTRYSDLPHSVRAKVPLHLLDFIAVAAAGSGVADSSSAVRAGLNALDSSTGPCSVICEPRLRGPEQAALLNGIWAHSLDFDDTTIVAALHPGAVVIPAVLAMAEAAGKEGPEVLSAIAVGYEVMCRVGAAMGTAPYDRGFHPTAIAGAFGATAAVGNLLGLDPTTLESALGLAGSTASGSMQYLEDGSHNKRLHPGLAARNAVLAASLASHGVVGAKHSLEGRRGAFSAYGMEHDETNATEDLGGKWVMLSTGIKPYPACRLTHGAVDAALLARANASQLAELAQRIKVRLHPRAIDLVGLDQVTKRRPSTSVDGQFSVWFQVAVTLLDGMPGWRAYGRIADTDVCSLIDRMVVEPDDTLPIAGASLQVVLPNSVLRYRVEEPSGEPGPGLNWELVTEKLRNATQGVWTADHCGHLKEAVQHLDQPGAFQRLTPLLRTMPGDRDEPEERS